MNPHLVALIDSIIACNGINDKSKLTSVIVEKFGLTRDRSVYYNDYYSIRFSQAMTTGFSNTVLALSNLQKYDSKPFIVCVVCPSCNYMLISNSTFLKKISHSSQELEMNNIRGSFNGSDIVRDFNGIPNTPPNFERLFAIHDSIGFETNLIRLVDATKGIVGTGHEYSISKSDRANILMAPNRAIEFMKSNDSRILKNELDERVKANRQSIIIASLIENVNIRGRVIEYLIAGEDEQLRQKIISSLVENQFGLPRFSTENSLGDYTKEFESFYTETDVKTKVMILDSNPKAYNIDKMLEFLSMNKSVFLFYFVGINPGEIFNTVLISMFETRLVKGTLLLKHWAGRNSRGVTQLEGKVIKDILTNPSNEIDTYESINHINNMINA
jgi:hypothetical protein